MFRWWENFFSTLISSFISSSSSAVTGITLIAANCPVFTCRPFTITSIAVNAFPLKCKTYFYHLPSILDRKFRCLLLQVVRKYQPDPANKVVIKNSETHRGETSLRLLIKKSSSIRSALTFKLAKSISSSTGLFCCACCIFALDGGASPPTPCRDSMFSTVSSQALFFSRDEACHSWTVSICMKRQKARRYRSIKWQTMMYHMSGCHLPELISSFHQVSSSCELKCWHCRLEVIFYL